MSHMKRRAARRDQNERAIVEALRARGAGVEFWDVQDLIVGYVGLNKIMEISNPEHLLKDGRFKASERKRKQRQALWRAAWPGDCVEVFSVEEALAELEAMKRS